MNAWVEAFGELHPYRTPDEKPKEILCGKPLRVRVGEGIVERRTPCKTPGWFARLCGGVKEDEWWTCDACGSRWQWCWRSDSRFENQPGDTSSSWRWRKLRMQEANPNRVESCGS